MKGKILQNGHSIRIGDRAISAGDPIYVIAEIGVNHNGNPEIAHRMIDEAASVGADAVKFQTFITDDVMIASAEKADYQENETGAGTQRDMVRGLELSFEEFAKLRDHCREVDIDFISTAFDPKSLDFIISLAPACLKWPSGEITNWPLLRQAAKSELPVLVSTGMASMREIAGALDVLGDQSEAVILQCVSNYPAAIEDQNLRVLPALAAAFKRPVGFSDHTLGPYTAIAAAALGMSVLEKHFTLDRNMSGPDHRASCEPGEFAEMITILRKIELGLGDGVKRCLSVEENVKTVARKSLVYKENFSAGYVLSPDDIIAKRPADGISPDHVDLIVGMQLGTAVSKDQPVHLSHSASTRC